MKILILIVLTEILFASTEAAPCDLSNSLLYPIPCVIQDKNNFLKHIGAHEFVDGTQSSTMAPLDSNLIVRNQLPSSPDKNHFYMYFAGAAYCGRNLPTLTCPWCENISSAGYEFKALIDEPIYNTQAFLAINHARRELVVAFRGSVNIPNVAEYLMFHMVNIGSGISIHSAYWAVTVNIYNDVVNSTRAFLAKGYKLVVAGHSLGGAMASVFVLRIMNEAAFPGTPIELYTYGAPRVGNKVFANYMNALNIVSSRITDYADVGPHVVPAGLGYYHHMTEFWIYNTSTPFTSTRYCSRSTYEDPTCSNSRGPKYNLIDHVIYFDVNIAQCVETDPLYYIPQFLFNLWVYLPRLLGVAFPEINLGTGLSDLVATLQRIEAVSVD